MRCFRSPLVKENISLLLLLLRGFFANRVRQSKALNLILSLFSFLFSNEPIYNNRYAYISE
jgi:hypothetical protein